MTARRWHPAHGVLAAVLPASARTFSSADRALTETLAASGAVEASAGAPDVEVATGAAALTGEAPCAIVVVRGSPAEGRGLGARVATRLGGAARAAASAAAARNRLRRLGYTTVDIVPFDQERRAQLRPLGAADARALPLGAVIAARRGDVGPTVLQAAASAAGEPAARSAARVGLSGVVLVLGAQRVLRVVLRAGDSQVAGALDFLAALRDAAPPAAVAERVAWPAADGELALARWVLEPRLPGGAPQQPGQALLDDCLEFLVALFSIGLDAPARPLGDAAQTVAAACAPQLGARVEALGARLDEQLAGVPRGVAHGDFWTENLLTADGRLTGVVDWSGAAGGRLPLVDLWHLLLHSTPGPRGRALGDAVVGWLVPLAQRGGGPMVQAYCRRIGLDADGALLRALAVAYWLEHAAHDLRAYADRRARPAWLARNVHAPAEALSR